MPLQIDYRRLDYHGMPEPFAGMYPGESAASEDLDALLKVETEADAVKFLDAYSPLFHSFETRFTRPSRLDETRLVPMVCDVLNTVMGMRVALDAYRLLSEGVTVEKLRGIGFSVYANGDEDSWLPTGEPWPAHTIRCGYSFEFHEQASHAFVGQRMGAFDADGNHAPDVWVVDAAASTYEDALAAFLDNLLTEQMQGIRIVSNGLSFDLSARDYSSFLWYEFFNRMTKGDIRICQACGKPFVANTGGKNERGSSTKQSCNNTCKNDASKARTAIRHMKRGMQREDAAKAARIPISKLQRYIELHPDELE